MSDRPYSQYSSTSRGGTVPQATETHISSTTVRALCGLASPFGFVAAGLCFYFLVEPFGTNPPPKEVALIAGIVFTCIGLGLAGVAIFFRGSIHAAGLDQLKAAARIHGTYSRLPAGVPVGAVPDPRTLAPSDAKPQRGRRGDVLGAVALLGILIGPGLAYLAFQREQVLKMGKPEAQVMRVSDLGRNGPGDNIHVKITDFEFGKNYMARSKGGNWTAVCLAAFPKGKSGDPRALKVVVRTSRVRDEKELLEFGKRAEIEGVVVNSIYEWESDKAYMNDAYPGADTSSIWVVQENYTFPNESEIKTLYTISSGIVGLAVFCGVGMFMRKMS